MLIYHTFRIAKFVFLIAVGSLLILIGCTQDEVPRTKAYQRFYFPKKSYRTYRSECGFGFEMPTYAQIDTKDSFRQQKLDDGACWMNLSFPEWNGKIHLSYKYFENTDELTKLLEDSYRLTSKHMVKASYIRDSIIDEPNLKGLVYSVGGNAASEKQFVLTDYKNKFIRGALYFHSSPNYDSMRPVCEFIDQDIYHMISTFSFDQK